MVCDADFAVAAPAMAPGAADACRGCGGCGCPAAAAWHDVWACQFLQQQQQQQQQQPHHWDGAKAAMQTMGCDAADAVCAADACDDDASVDDACSVSGTPRHASRSPAARGTASDRTACWEPPEQQEQQWQQHQQQLLLQQQQHQQQHQQHQQPHYERGGALGAAPRAGAGLRPLVAALVWAADRLGARADGEVLMFALHLWQRVAARVDERRVAWLVAEARARLALAATAAAAAPAPGDCSADAWARWHDAAAAAAAAAAAPAPPLHTALLVTLWLASKVEGARGAAAKAAKAAEAAGVDGPGIVDLELYILELLDFRPYLDW